MQYIKQGVFMLYISLALCLMLLGNRSCADQITFNRLSYADTFNFNKKEKAELYKEFLKQQHQDASVHTITEFDPIGRPLVHFEVKPTTGLTQTHGFMNQECVKDLELKRVADSLETQTKFGSWGAYDLLLNPLDSYEDIIARQQALQALINQKDVYTKVHHFLHTTSWEPVLSYWHTNSLHDKAKKLYFSAATQWVVRLVLTLGYKKDSLNKSSTALTVAHNTAIAQFIGKFLFEQGFGSAMGEVLHGAYHKQMPHINLQTLARGVLHPLIINLPFLHEFKNGDSQANPLLEANKFSAGDWKLYIEKHLPQAVPEKVRPYLSSACSLGYVGYFDYIFYTNMRRKLDDVHLLAVTMKELQSSVRSIAQAINRTKTLTLDLHNDAQLKKLPGVAQLHTFLIDKTHNSKKLNQLLELLESPTLLQDGITIQKGKVLVAHKLLCSIKHELIPLFQAIGKLDAAYSIATLCNSAEGRWCFPQFTQSTQARLVITNGVHPLIPANKVVANSISFTDKQHAIFSGPNGGGKSTTMQMIALTILLSQSWGIAPAQHVELTPFTALLTYLAPQASLADGVSTFMAEKAQLDAITQKIRNLPESQHIFVMLDEPLRGTIEKEAGQRICIFGKEVAKHANCITVIASHIEKPTTLASTTNNFANYQMELIDTQDSFERTFKLLPGAADWWFHDDVRRGKFIDSYE